MAEPDRDANTLPEAVAKSKKGSSLSLVWAIPLVDLPPGPYELMISVQDVASNRTVAMQEGFEVVSND